MSSLLTGDITTLIPVVSLYLLCLCLPLPLPNRPLASAFSLCLTAARTVAAAGSCLQEGKVGRMTGGSDVNTTPADVQVAPLRTTPVLPHLPSQCALLLLHMCISTINTVLIDSGIQVPSFLTYGVLMEFRWKPCGSSPGTAERPRATRLPGGLTSRMIISECFDQSGRGCLHFL